VFRLFALAAGVLEPLIMALVPLVVVLVTKITTLLLAALHIRLWLALQEQVMVVTAATLIL
jgi:hypothetical protein